MLLNFMDLLFMDLHVSLEFLGMRRCISVFLCDDLRIKFAMDWYVWLYVFTPYHFLDREFQFYDYIILEFFKIAWVVFETVICKECKIKFAIDLYVWIYLLTSLLPFKCNLTVFWTLELRNSWISRKCVSGLSKFFFAMNLK